MTEISSQVLIDVVSDPRYRYLSFLNKPAALSAEAVLNHCAQQGFIDLGIVKRSLDFGACWGGSTLASSVLADRNGGIAEAVEETYQTAPLVTQLGIVRPEHMHVGDGIEFLGRTSSAGQYDMVTAFMLGPDVFGTLARDLLRVSRRALSPDGRLVITSDPYTMDAANARCTDAALSYEYMSALGPTAVDAIVARFSD